MKVAFIGLGIMGEAMCSNILRKHDDLVYVYDLVKAQVDLLESRGAFPCKSALEAARNSDVIITMVPKSEHSRAVYSEIIEILDRTKTCIDMSTIDPSVSMKIADMVKKTGAEFIDAPVVKSRPAAEAGFLGIYVGGNKKAYERMKPILSYMGSNIIHMGGNGKGLVMKICHNTLVAQIQNGVNETICLAQKYGIDIDAYSRAISYGGGQNFYLDGKAASIRDENYSTVFSVENMAKDLGICQSLARESSMKMPGMENAKNIYDKAMKMGVAKEDFCATIKTVRKEVQQI